MNKENNCQCVVCNVEAALLDSFSTQIARTQFQALASIYPVLNHFSSPIDLVEYLHQQDNAANHNAGSEILHAVIHAIAERATREFGQQLLLLAFTPAIHKLCREISQRFPSLTPEDIAQQAVLCLLEAARSTFIARQNGHLLLALVREFRKNTFRWAIKEARITTAEEENSETECPEQVSEDTLERDYALDDFLQRCRSRGVLSDADYELLLKFHCEEFEAMELRSSRWRSAKAVHHRLEKILNRLRRIAADPDSLQLDHATVPTSPISAKQNKSQSGGGISPGVCPFSNSEKGFSPELSRPMPQVETDVTHIAA
ncbi:MAG TPA: hypothetical protein VN577_07955 [Terriglobales bacterium]|nr:hypothetical protein [Terriglobales bacterium]